MQSFQWYMRRLRTMGPQEIIWRLRGLMRDQIDLLRIPARLLPRIEKNAIRDLRSFRPGFDFSKVDHDSWQDLPTMLKEEWQHRLVTEADELLANRLSYFDLKNIDHGDPFNWHRDHSSTIDSPQTLSILIDYRNFQAVGDCKLVWEPNRHHQFVTLARAYAVTNDTRYARHLCHLWRSWLSDNPFGYGMNWRSPLEIGVRLINWVWTIDLIRNSDEIDAELWDGIQSTVYLSLWEISRKYSRGSSANNHLIGEAAGVFIAASYFRNLPQAEQLLDASKSILEREILAQTYPDGCTQEHAFGYQLFVMQFFLLCAVAAERTENAFSRDFLDRLHSMFKFVREIISDVGVVPNMGDSDDGYVLDLGEKPSFGLHFLSLGAQFFADDDLRQPINSESGFWLFGAQPESPTPPPRIHKSSCLSSSGYAVLRSGRLSALFDFAELGYGPIAAHGHADCLSFLLNVDGHPFLIDPGTFDYFTHPEWRSYFRSTRAHNTIEVDGENQSQMLGPFMWGLRAKAELSDWHDDTEATAITATHDGYSRLADPVKHQRSLSLSKNANELIVTDHLVCKGAHSAVLHYHLHHGVAVSQLDDQIILESHQRRLSFQAAGASVAVHRAAPDNKLGWVSDGYHRRSPSLCIVARADITGDTVLTSKFRLLSD